MIDMKNTSNGEPVTNQAPAEVTTATPAAEATATAASETTAPATLDEATHAAHRQRVEELKKSLTSYSNTATPAEPAATESNTPATPDAAPAPTPADAPVDTTATNDATAPETAPATTTDTDAPADAPSDTPALAVGRLPAEYLCNGYFKGEGQNKYPDPALIDQEEQIAAQLAADDVTVTAINRMVKTLKDAKKLPFEGQQGAIKKLLPLALKEKNPLLRELVEKNRAAVRTSEDYTACLEHFQDVAIFLAAAKAS